MKILKSFLFFNCRTSWTIWCADPWLISRYVAISFTVTRQFSFTMASTAAMTSGVTTRCAWPGRGQSVTELTPFMNFLVHSYSCCSDRHASPYWTFIRRWIKRDFTPSLLKKRMTGRCPSLVHVASVSAKFTLLLRRRLAFLHRTATCRPLFKPWVSLLSTCRQSSCFSNFYRTFNVFIWLSLVHCEQYVTSTHCQTTYRQLHKRPPATLTYLLIDYYEPNREHKNETERKKEREGILWPAVAMFPLVWQCRSQPQDQYFFVWVFCSKRDQKRNEVNLIFLVALTLTPRSLNWSLNAQFS